LPFSSRSPPGPENEGSGLGVLVVDDDSNLLRTLADILRRRGYETQTAKSGGEGLEMIAASSARPAIAVVDLGLPDMNGMDLVHRLRGLSELTEVVILTGNASLESALAALREQSYDYLVKPVAPEALLGSLQRAGERWRRHQIEESLRRSEQRFRQLVENISDVVLVVDRDGNVQYGNQRIEAALGVTPEGAEGLQIFERVHPDDVEAARRLLRGPTSEPIELRVRRRDGNWRLFACRSADLIIESQSAAVVVLAQDVTDRRRLEAQALQAQKLDSIGRLAGGVAHDFNNLLTVVLGYSELGLAHPALDAEVRSLLETIHAAGERGAALTRQLLAFGRRQPNEPRLIDLNEVVRGVEPLLRSSFGTVELEVLLNRAPVFVRADLAQLEQVVMNLAFNAGDAMPTGGTLTIGTQRLPGPPTGAPGGQERGEAVLVVSDTGVGMDEETRSRVFEPFFTTKETGTGLGLPTVYGIVHQAGGHLRIDSSLGAGTRVEVHLPLAPESAAGITEARPLLHAGDGETVLVVDDEPAVVDLVRRILEGLGYRVHTAGSGTEALGLIQTGHLQPALLLTDKVMPGMSGEELAARLRELQPELRVLFMSGYSDPTAPGGLPVLAKPLSPLTLHDAVRAALGSRA
jgi:two-component system, cell cycle sensor histidine kinase and response regulator CckA